MLIKKAKIISWRSPCVAWQLYPCAPFRHGCGSSRSNGGSSAGDAAVRVQVPSGRTSLPWICDQLSVNWQGQVVDLRGHCVAPVGATPPSAGPFASETQPALPEATPISVCMKQPASRGVGAVWELEARPHDAELWTVASVGTTLRNGRIELPESGFLVLDGACEGFTMQNIIIRGAGHSLQGRCRDRAENRSDNCSSISCLICGRDIGGHGRPGLYVVAAERRLLSEPA